MKKITLYSPGTFVADGMIDIMDEKKKFFISLCTHSPEGLNLICRKELTI